MLRYALKRALSLTVSLIAASVVIFCVIEIIPGDPASYMLGLNAQVSRDVRRRLSLLSFVPCLLENVPQLHV